MSTGSSGSGKVAHINGETRGRNVLKSELLEGRLEILTLSAPSSVVVWYHRCPKVASCLIWHWEFSYFEGEAVPHREITQTGTEGRGKSSLTKGNFFLQKLPYWLFGCPGTETRLQEFQFIRIFTTKQTHFLNRAPDRPERPLRRPEYCYKGISKYQIF
jgi:hypothetical protein